jgi:ATP-dependent helicase/nuclease subunit A
VTADHEARRIAVTDFERNLVVTAGAGTGKTSLLVERALNLVVGRDVPITAVAAITFTEKAAAELRDRLAAGLDAVRGLAAGGAPAGTIAAPTEAERSYAWLRESCGLDAPLIATRALRALVDLDAAQVGTIHAFCADILRRHPVEAGVDPAFGVDEGGSFDALFEAEAARFLQAELGPRAGREALWRRVLQIPDGTAAVRAIAAAPGAFRLPDPAGDGAGGAAALPGAMLRGLGEAIAAALARRPPMNPRMASYLEAARDLLGAAAAGGLAAIAAQRAAIAGRLAKDPPSPGSRLPAAEAEAIAALARRARSLLQALLAVDEEGIDALLRAAAPLAAAARAALLRAGWVSFDGLLRLSRDLLAARPVIRRALGRRYRAILLDEFQDTDPLQYEILFFIAEEDGAAAADAWRARLAPGRLFIVGDPKQSIYRFRGADIEAYQRAVRRVRECGGREVTLTSSFRSPAGILGPINRLFAGFMVPEPDGGEAFQARYAPLDAARGVSGPPDPRVAIWTVMTEPEADAGARRAAEAAAIAAWIARHAGRDDATGRPLRHGDVALLLRALTNAGLYAQALRRAGIPFLVDGGREFYERPEVGDLIAFLRAVANPNDGPAVLAVMRSALGGVPDGDLARFARAGGRFDLPGGGPAADPAAHPAVARVFALIDSFRARQRGRPADAVVRAAVRDTPLGLLHAAAFEGAQRSANLAKLVAEAEDLARRGLSLAETIGVLEDERRSARDAGDSPLADETLDAVRVLSIHKAKGLEYPVVFVPDLGRQERPPARSEVAVAWLPGEGGGRPAVRLRDGACNVAWVEHEERARRHEAAEEARVFYVACTRARERLILVSSNTKNGGAPWRDSLAALGYAADQGVPVEGPISPGVEHRIVREAAVPEAPVAAPVDDGWAEAARAFEAAAAAAAAGAAPPLRRPSGTPGDRLPADPSASLEAGPAAAPDPAAARQRRPAAGAARLAGSAVHAALEGWDFRDPDALRARARGAVDRLALRDAPGDAAVLRRRLAEARAETDAILDGFFASALPARLRAADIVGREVPVLYRDAGGATWAGVCDLIYRDAQGRLVVADYKTERAEGDPAAAAEPYRAQVAAYREAVARVFPDREVRAEILFVRAGTAVPL